MDENISYESQELLESTFHLPALLFMFFASGCAALIYEVVWFQFLQLIIGSTAVSLAVLLGTYMGGMSLGSLLLPRLVSIRRHPLRVYGLIEGGIGLSGLAILFGLPIVVRFYSANAGTSGFSGILMQGIVCALCLLIPTILMGATLPAIGRWTGTTPQGIKWMGYLYGTNIAGAVLGCLLAAFVLLRIYDTEISTFFAAGINIVLGLSGFILAARSTHHPVQSEPKKDKKFSVKGSGPVYLTIALSGFSALGAEVIWTRLLSITLGATVYSFAIILAVFLAGLGFGSGVGARLTHSKLNSRTALGLSQMGLTAAVAWSAFMIVKVIPSWTAGPASSLSSWLSMGFDVVRCLAAFLPAAFLWGASFPLALAAAARRGEDGGQLAGKIYASNTIGAIIGAVLFSTVLIPLIGTQDAHRMIVGVSFLSAALVLISRFSSKLKYIAITAGAMTSVVLLIWIIPPVSGELIAYGRYLPQKSGTGMVLYKGEGMNASVAVTETTGNTRIFHISGRVEASTSGQDMRMERMLGHLPAVLHSQPRSVLVVGCGAGVTAGTFVLYPGIERIVICEIEKLIPKMVAGYFKEQNYTVLDDPRVEVVYDDARHYILTSRETFDIITTDPIHPWIKGSASLYTLEYLEMAKEHLNPGGLIAQWVPLYESTADTVQSEVATFFNAFPNGTIWSNDNMYWGYDMILLGKTGNLTIDLDRLREWQKEDPHNKIFQSLADIGFSSVLDMFVTYTGRATDLTNWLAGAEINRDKNLRLQYLAGMGSYSTEGGLIYENLYNMIKFPEDLFVGSKELILLLKQRMGLNEPHE